MSYFKFLDSRDAHYVTGGQLRFGNLQKYRLLELLSGDDWIGDRREGLSITHVKEEHSGKWVLRNNRYIQHNVGYAFCFSHGDHGELRAVMMQDSPYSYDGAVEITNLNALASAVVQGSHSAGRVGDDFTVYVADCTYEDTPEIAVIDSGEPLQSSPFVKQLKYKPQAETRIFLQPRRRMRMFDDLDVTIRAPSGLLVELHAEDCATQAPSRFRLSRDEAVACLKQVLGRWDAGVAAGADLDHLHADLMPTLGEAYGSLRFRHKWVSSALDTVLVLPHFTPEPTYKMVELMLRDIADGRYIRE